MFVEQQLIDKRRVSFLHGNGSTCSSALAVISVIWIGLNVFVMLVALDLIGISVLRA